MNKFLLGTMAISGVTPALMGAAGVPVPSNAPEWLPWILSLCGPLLAGLGALGIRIVAALLLSEAKQLEEDNDPSNDHKAVKLREVAKALLDKSDKKDKDE
jgi:hypothetical protein